jgi:hypothetical protein
MWSRVDVSEERISSSFRVLEFSCDEPAAHASREHIVIFVDEWGVKISNVFAMRRFILPDAFFFILF